MYIIIIKFLYETKILIAICYCRIIIRHCRIYIPIYICYSIYIITICLWRFLQYQKNNMLCSTAEIDQVLNHNYYLYHLLYETLIWNIYWKNNQYHYMPIKHIQNIHINYIYEENLIKNMYIQNIHYHY